MDIYKNYIKEIDTKILKLRQETDSGKAIDQENIDLLIEIAISGEMANELLRDFILHLNKQTFTF